MREIRELLGVEARVVRFGCGQLSDREADEAVAAPLPARRPYLLYVGALEPRKNIFSLLEVFEHVRSALGADLGLILAGGGRGPYVAAVKARVARSPERERVQIVEQAARTEVLELLAHASALILPTAAEGFGLPILEALALGTPVVASDIPAIRSWAADAVGYAPADQPAAWIEPSEAALASDEERRRSGQVLASNYRWRECAQELVNF